MITIAIILVIIMVLGFLIGGISEHLGRRPTYHDVESWGWGEHGKDWEYDRNNRPRRINRWSNHHEG
jgi:hypothetical protein